MPCRWLQKRGRRYSHIVCVLCSPDSFLLPEEFYWGGPISSIPPLLHFLLADRGPTAQFSLIVEGRDGELARANNCLQNIFQCKIDMAA